uniref:Calcium homeostasis modulator 1 n=1 Tax=Panagrolaimus sp. PS1159 TaxID=55785 RepID=A0AC35GVF9_9BILA
MARKALDAVDSTAFGTISGLFRNYGSHVMKGFIIISTISGQSLIGKLTFECPCAYPLNVLHSITFIFGPSIALFFLSLLVNPKTWKMVHGCFNRTVILVHTKVVVFKKFLQVFGKSTIAPVVWIFVAFLNGDYYKCMNATRFCYKNDTSLCNNTSSGKDIMELDLMNGGNKNICHLCLCSLDPVIDQYLRSESQVVAWIFIIFVGFFALIMVCIERMLDKQTYVQWEYIQMYRDEEKRVFDETAKEYARNLAEKQAELFFSKSIHSKKDWDSLSIFVDYKNHRFFQNRVNNKQHLIENEEFTALQHWANEQCKNMSSFASKSHEEKKLIKNV